MCLSGYTMMVKVMLELHKLPFRTAQIHLELPFFWSMHAKKPCCSYVYERHD